MIIRCGWCGRDLGEKEPLDNQSETTGICPGCARASLIDASICPECDGDLQETKGGQHCPACRWYFMPPMDIDPSPAPVEMIDALLDGNAIMTPYGICGPGFDSHDPPWRHGRQEF